MLGWKGALTIGSETIPHEAFHTLVLSAQEGETGVKITAAEDNSEFVLVRLKPLIESQRPDCNTILLIDCRRTPGSDSVSIWPLRHDRPRGNSEDFDRL